jgi:hypothetical protein
VTPEPYTVVGGPFTLKIERTADVVSMIVNGDKGDLVTQIDFNAARIPSVVAALLRASGDIE